MDPILTPALVQAGAGLLQGVFGSLGAAKARKQAEKEIKGMTLDQSIVDLYNKAYNRYAINPYQSAFYQQRQNQINRGLATAVTAGEDVGTAVQRASDQSAQAAGMAEQQGRQDFSNLGYASRLLSGERQRIQDYKTNLMMQKWANKAQMANQGFQNIFEGAANLAYMYGGQDNQGGGRNPSDRIAARQQRRSNATKKNK